MKMHRDRPQRQVLRVKVVCTLFVLERALKMKKTAERCLCLLLATVLFCSAPSAGMISRADDSYTASLGESTEEPCTESQNTEGQSDGESGEEESDFDAQEPETEESDTENPDRADQETDGRIQEDSDGEASSAEENDAEEQLMGISDEGGDETEITEEEETDDDGSEAVEIVVATEEAVEQAEQDEITPYDNYGYGDPACSGNFVYAVDEDGNEIPEIYTDDVEEIIELAEEGMDLAHFFRGTIFSGFTIETLRSMAEAEYNFSYITGRYLSGRELPDWVYEALGRSEYVDLYGVLLLSGENDVPSSLTSAGIGSLGGSALGVISSLGSSRAHDKVVKLYAKDNSGTRHTAFCALYGGSYRTGWHYEQVDYSSIIAPNGTALSSYQYNLIKCVVNCYLKTTQQQSHDYAAMQLAIWYIINNMPDDSVYFDIDVAWNDGGISEAAGKIYGGDASYVYGALSTFSNAINHYMDGTLDFDDFTNVSGIDYYPGSHAELCFWVCPAQTNAQWIITWSIGTSPVSAVAGELLIPYIENYDLEKKASAQYCVEITKESIITNELLEGVRFQVVESEDTDSAGNYGISVPYMDEDVEPSGGDHQTELMTDANGYAYTSFVHEHSFRESYSQYMKEPGEETDQDTYESLWAEALAAAATLSVGDVLAVSYMGDSVELTAEELEEIYEEQQDAWTQAKESAQGTLEEQYDSYMSRTYRYTVTELDQYTRGSANDSNGRTLAEVTLPLAGYRRDVNGATTIGTYSEIVSNGGTMTVGGRNDSDSGASNTNVTDEPWYNQIFINKTDLESGAQILYDTEFEIYEYYQWTAQATAQKKTLYPSMLLSGLIREKGSALQTELIAAAELTVTDESGHEYESWNLDVAKLVDNLATPYAYALSYTPTAAGDYLARLEITIDSSQDLSLADTLYYETTELVETGKGVYQLLAEMENQIAISDTEILGAGAMLYTTADGGTISYEVDAASGLWQYVYTDTEGTESVYTAQDDGAHIEYSSGGTVFVYESMEDTGIVLYSDDGVSYTGEGNGLYFVAAAVDADGSVTLYYYTGTILADGTYRYDSAFSVSTGQLTVAERDYGLAADPDDYTTWGQKNYEIVRVTADIAKEMGWPDTVIGMYTVHRISVTDQYCGTNFSSATDTDTGVSYGYDSYGTLYYTQANLGRFCIVEKSAPADGERNGYLGNYSDRDGTGEQASTEKLVHYLNLCEDTNQYATYMLTDGHEGYENAYYANDVGTLDDYDALTYEQFGLQEMIALQRYALGSAVQDVLNVFWDRYWNQYLSGESGLLISRDSQKSDTYFALVKSADVQLHFVGTTVNADSYDDNLSSASRITYYGTYTDIAINYHSYAGDEAAVLNVRSGFHDRDFLQVGEVVCDGASQEAAARTDHTQASVTDAVEYSFIDERGYGYLKFSKQDAEAERYVDGDLAEAYAAGTDHGDAGLDGAIYSLYVSEDSSFEVQYLEGTLDGKLFWAQPIAAGGYRIIYDGDDDGSAFTDLGTNAYQDYPHAYLSGGKLYFDYTDSKAGYVSVEAKNVSYGGIRHPDGMYGGAKHNGWFAVLEEQQVFIDTDGDGYADTWTLQDVTLQAGAKVASAVIADGEFEMNGLYLGEYDLVEEIRSSVVLFSTDNNDEESAEIHWLSFAPGYLAATDGDGNPQKYHYSFLYQDEMQEGTLVEAEQIYRRNETDGVSEQQVIKAGFQIRKLTTGGESASSGNTAGTALEGAGFTVYLLSELSLIQDGTIAAAWSEDEGNMLVKENALVALMDESDSFVGYQYTKSYIAENQPFKGKYGSDYELSEVNRLVYIAGHGYYYMEDILAAYRNLYYSNESGKWDFSGEEQAVARMYEDDETMVAAINADYTYKANRLNSGSPCEWYGVNGISEGWVATGVENEYRLSEIFTNHYGNLRSPELPWGAYLVVETTTPEDVFTVDPLFVTVSDSSTSENRAKSVAQTDASIVASLILVKRDAQSGQTVTQSGISFRIWDYQNNQYVSKYLSGPDGELTMIAQRVFSTDESGRLNAVASLEAGTYRLEELNAPDGYYNLYLDSGYGTVDFEVTTDRRYQASGIVSSGNLDYLYIGETMYDDEVLGKLSILKTGEVLTDYDEDESDFVYEERPLADAVYEITAAEDIPTQDGSGWWFREGDVVATVTTGEEGEYVSFEPNYRTAENTGGGSYDYTYYYGSGTSFTSSKEYSGEQFSSSGGVANYWIAGRMSELDQALYGIPAYTDETVYPNTYYKEQTQQILRHYYREGASEEPVVTDYVTRLDAESGLASSEAGILTETAEGYRLTWTSQQLYSGAYLTQNGEDTVLTLADGSGITLEPCTDVYQVTESHVDGWAQGDLVECTESGYRISHTTEVQPGVSGGAQTDAAVDLGYTRVMSYRSAAIVEQGDGSFILYDETGNPIVTMESGLYETSSGALVVRTSSGWSVTETRCEEISDNRYVQAELSLQGGTLTVKNETWTLLWDAASQIFRTTGGNTVELAADGASVTVTVAGIQTSYQVYELTLEYTLHYATAEPIVRVENDGTLGTVSVYLPLGSYEVREIAAPYGFLLSAQTQTVELTYVDQTTEVVFDAQEDFLNFYNQRIKPWSTSEEEQRKLGVGVYKADAGSGALLLGARFGLYTADDIYNVDGELLVEAGALLACATTDADGFANFAVNIALMSKYQDEDAAEAELIYQASVSGDTVERSIDGNTALNTGNYYIQELTPPDGYLMDDTVYPVSFAYEDEYTLYIPVYAEHENEPTAVTLTKMDLTGEEEVSGATISVYRILDSSLLDKDGQISHAQDNLALVDTWVSTEEAHTVEGLWLSNSE